MDGIIDIKSKRGRKKRKVKLGRLRKPPKGLSTPVLNKPLLKRLLLR